MHDTGGVGGGHHGGDLPGYQERIQGGAGDNRIAQRRPLDQFQNQPVASASSM